MLVAAVLVQSAGCGLLPPPPREWGMPTTPIASSDLAGVYVQIDLAVTLNTNSTYKARGGDCISPYPEAVGNWTAAGNQIIFDPPIDKGVAGEELHRLDVLSHRGKLILVPTVGHGRRWYDKRGISYFTCLQRESVLKAEWSR